MEKCLETLCSRIVCRDKQISTIYSLLSPKIAIPNSLYAYGNASTGKSLVIRGVLDYLKLNYAIVNCVELPNMKLLLERIVDILWSNISTTKTSLKCNNIYEFINHLQKIVEINSTNIVIAIENASRLRDFDQTFLSSLLRLQQLSKIRVCVILESDIAWEKHVIKNGMAKPLKIYFPQYTKDEVTVILELLYDDHDNKIYMDMYPNYLQLYLSTYMRYCRDLRELRYMAKVNFKKYVEPLESGELTKNDTTKLWWKIKPILKANLEVIYLRISAEDLDEKKNVINQMDSTRQLIQSFELPWYSKYMLVAAFLASYIPARMDKQYFRKASDNNKKKKAGSKNTKISFTTPHSFSLDRMMGIFCFINDDEVDVNSTLLVQIPTMCRLGLLTRVGYNKLNEIKYKCCIDWAFIEIISKMIGFDVRQFLTKF